MAMMHLDLLGRINNTPKPPVTRPLLPILEAVANSIQAIQARGARDGKIEVILERHNESLFHTEKAPIRNCIIVDNGIGFDGENFQSFCTSDTTHKILIGGKGVGRFSWLKTFEAVSIVSDHKEGVQWLRRSFVFELKDSGITNVECAPAKSEAYRTAVHLMNLDQVYAKRIPQSTELIAREILEHCILYFVHNEAPSIVIHDGPDSIILEHMYRDVYGHHFGVDHFVVGAHEFFVAHMRLYAPKVEPRIYLCAQRRVVRDESMSKYVPNLAHRVTEGGQSFAWVGFISGDYLDKHTNVDRTDFTIDEHDTSRDLYGAVTLADIRNAVSLLLKSSMRGVIQRIQDEKVEMVNSFLVNAPQFKYVLRRRPEVLEAIPPNASDADIDEQLSRARFELDVEIRKLGRELQPLGLSSDNPETAEKYRRYIESVNEMKMSNLAQHVIYRRLVLDLLQRSINRMANGDYSYERQIHRLIFPMKQTSERVPYEYQNLWLIDERLSYHLLLFSDLDPTQKEDAAPTEGGAAVEPGEASIADLSIFFDNPHVFAERKRDIDSVVLVEFKRPMLDNYTTAKNPVIQVINSIDRIRSRKVSTTDGRPVTITTSTRFYCYIVCDITPSFVRVAALNDLRQTADGRGYYKHHEQFNAYIEVVSYDKLVADAEARNRILFDKLELPRG